MPIWAQPTDVTMVRAPTFPLPSVVVVTPPAPDAEPGEAAEDLEHDATPDSPATTSPARYALVYTFDTYPPLVSWSHSALVRPSATSATLPPRTWHRTPTVVPSAIRRTRTAVRSGSSRTATPTGPAPLIVTRSSLGRVVVGVAESDAARLRLVVAFRFVRVVVARRTVGVRVDFATAFAAVVGGTVGAGANTAGAGAGTDGVVPAALTPAPTGRAPIPQTPRATQDATSAETRSDGRATCRRGKIRWNWDAPCRTLQPYAARAPTVGSRDCPVQRGGQTVDTLSNIAVSFAFTFEPATIFSVTAFSANGSAVDAITVQVPGEVAPLAYSQ